MAVFLFIKAIKEQPKSLMDIPNKISIKPPFTEQNKPDFKKMAQKTMEKARVVFKIILAKLKEKSLLLLKKWKGFSPKKKIISVVLAIFLVFIFNTCSGDNDRGDAKYMAWLQKTCGIYNSTKFYGDMFDDPVALMGVNCDLKKITKYELTEFTNKKAQELYKKYFKVKALMRTYKVGEREEPLNIVEVEVTLKSKPDTTENVSVWLFRGRFTSLKHNFDDKQTKKFWFVADSMENIRIEANFLDKTALRFKEK